MKAAHCYIARRRIYQNQYLIIRVCPAEIVCSLALEPLPFPCTHLPVFGLDCKLDFEVKPDTGHFNLRSEVCDAIYAASMTFVACSVEVRAVLLVFKAVCDLPDVVSCISFKAAVEPRCFACYIRKCFFDVAVEFAFAVWRRERVYTCLFALTLRPTICSFKESLELNS